MFCVECGKRLDDDAKFCSSCGKPQKQTSSANTEQGSQSAKEETKPEEGLEKSNKPDSFFLPDIIEDSFNVCLGAVISSNGKYLLFRKSQNDGNFQIMDTQSKEINVVHPNNFAYDLSPDGNFIIINESGEDSLWDVQKEKKIYGSIPGCSPHSFSSDSKRLAVLLDFNDGNIKKIKVLNTENGNEVFSISDKKYALDRFCKLKYSPDGRYLVATFSYGMFNFSKGPSGMIWDARNGNEISTVDYNYSLRDITFSHDGNRIVISGKSIAICNTQNGSLLLQIDHEYHHDSDLVLALPLDRSNCVVCFSPDDRTIAAGFNDGKIEIYNAETGELLKELKGTEYGYEWLAFTPDGNKLITYDGNIVKFWVADNLQA